MKHVRRQTSGALSEERKTETDTEKRKKERKGLKILL
jgi:hypothetical protein